MDELTNAERLCLLKLVNRDLIKALQSPSATVARIEILYVLQRKLKASK